MSGEKHLRATPGKLDGRAGVPDQPHGHRPSRGTGAAGPRRRGAGVRLTLLAAGQDVPVGPAAAAARRPPSPLPDELLKEPQSLGIAISATGTWTTDSELGSPAPRRPRLFEVSGAVSERVGPSRRDCDDPSWDLRCSA